jgi:hypothetical protein
MKVRIVSDGKSRYGTHLTSVETGEEMQYVTEATIQFEGGKPYPTATLVIASPEVDMIVDAEIKHVCPYCGRPVGEKEGKP